MLIKLDYVKLRLKRPATVKNLYVNPTATLKLGGTELGNIYDGNQLYLNGGKIVTPVIDGSDFTWNSGKLYISSGKHTSGYCIATGSGKALHIWYGAKVNLSHINSLPDNNRIEFGSIDMGMFGGPHAGGKLIVNDFDASNVNMAWSGTFEVHGTLTGFWNSSLKDFATLNLIGADASWNVGERLYLGPNEGRSHVSIADGAVVASAGISTHGTGAQSGVEVIGKGSTWTSTGSINFSGQWENYLRIKDGGSVSATGLDLWSSMGAGHSVEVEGSGSTLNLTGGVSIDANSFQGTGSLMVVTNGGTASSAAARLGQTSPGNWVRVDGENSAWTISGDLTEGIDGVENGVTVANGAVLSCEDVIIGK